MMCNLSNEHRALNDAIPIRHPSRLMEAYCKSENEAAIILRLLI